MKKLIAVALSALALLVCGCKGTPTVDEMTKTATTIGRAAGLVANQTKIDDASRAVVIEIVTRATNVVPKVDQSFTDAWTPIATEVTNKLVAEGKIDAGQAILIQGAFTVACKGLDYLTTVKYPKARQYENLTSAAVYGFSGGFLEVFKPTNGALAAVKAAYEYDQGAYDYLMKAQKKAEPKKAEPPKA